MAVVHENWERLVTAALRREQLREIAMRTPSNLSSVSAVSPSPSFNLSSRYGQVLPLLVGDAFSYHQILRATDFFKGSNLIKSGRSGDLYFGVLEGGTEVVVKRVDVSSLDKELCFVSEMEIYGMLKHSRLIPLLGHCLDNANDKFLVYKYMPNKDLSKFLNGNIDGDRRSASLDWTTRLKIATGILEGLWYLHREYSPPLVHRDIQASSILLDDKFEVQLGSLSRVCIEENDNNETRTPRFPRLPKRVGRSSPGTSNARFWYDVYCFGKVLLQLITGKSTPVNDSSGKDWIGSTLRHIVPDNKKLIVNIADPSLIINEDLLLEVWVVASVAKVCLNHNTSKCPQVEEILTVLQNLAADHTPGVRRTPERFKRIGRMTLEIKPGSSNSRRLKFEKMRGSQDSLEDCTVTKPQRYCLDDIKKISNCIFVRLCDGEETLPNQVIFAVKLFNFPILVISKAPHP